MSRVKAFYEREGRALFAPWNYPLPISDHLADERASLVRVLGAGGYVTAIEVGCGDGSLHLDAIIGLGLGYIGIDLVETAVEQVQRKLDRDYPGRWAKARALDAERLTALGRLDHALAVFSFNAYGNLSRPEAVVAELARAGCDAFIPTYRVEASSTQARRTYYERCRYTELVETRDDRGVLFTAREGLHTYAYDAAWLVPLLVRRGFRVTVENFGTIGVSYWARLP